MSRASRLAKASTRIEPPRGPDGKFIKVIGQLGLNSAGVPGGVGTVVLDKPVTAAGIEWTPTDGQWDRSPIGAALALETAGAR